MKTKYLLLQLLLLPALLQAQTVGYQSTPATSSSASVTQAQMGNTGGVSVSIPLAGFSTDFASVPVSINYFSDGTRVDDISSQVGHNWSLFAGGVITREVRDEVDDPNSPVDLSQLSSPTDDALISQYAEDDDFDSEPDLFSFNFGGRSGTFVIDGNGDFVVMPHQVLDITATSFGGDINEFAITTDVGMKYYFGSSAIEALYGDNPDVYTSLVGSKTAWYLYKIEDRISNRVIDLTYTLTVALQEVTGTVQARYVTKSVSPCTDELSLNQQQSHWTRYPQLIRISSTNYGELNFTYSGKYLDKVTSKSATGEVRAITELKYDTHLSRKFLKEVIQTDAYGEVAAKHEFTYINPQDLPARLSYAQDHWGYFNGKLANDTTAGTLLPQNDVLADEVVTTEYFGIDGADRLPDPAMAQKGMLETVKYPGGAIVTYTYQGNTVIEPVTTYTSQTDTNYMSDNNDAGNKSHTFTSYYSQQVSIALSMNDSDPSPGGKLTVTDVLDDTPLSGLDGYQFSSGDTKTFLAIQGKVYRVTVEMIDTFQPTRVANANTSYLVPVNPMTTNQEITVGGVRLSQVTHKDPLSGEETKTQYYYGPKNDHLTSSGVRYHKLNYASYVTNYTKTGNSSTCNYIALNSTPNQLSGSSGNSGVYYEYVTLSEGGTNFENGGMQYQYELQANSAPVKITGAQIHQAPWSNDAWKSGRLQAEEVFKKNGSSFLILSKSSYNYTKDVGRSQQVLSQVIRKRYEDAGYTGPQKYDVTNYHYHSDFGYLSQRDHYAYDENGANPVQTTTSYTYGSTSHPYLKESSTTDSEGEVHTVTYNYPQDYASPGSVISQMITDKVTALPVETITEVDGITTGASATEFEYDSDYNYLAAKKRWVKENVSGSYSPADGQTFTSPYRWVSEVLKRDDQGHVLSEHDRSGLTTTYIRGYDGKHLVATVQNASYSQVKAALSLNDNLRLTGALTEAQVTALRTGLPDARVTVYTYKIGYGLSMVEDVNGRKQYYTYDSFGRVKYVKDHDENVLSSQSYYLKN